jgi:uncharacterized membrane protein YebE (DUF533 family)
MLSGAGKGALAAGAVAVLLGTPTGRKITGTSLKLGSLAAIGTVAYQAFKDWQNKQDQPQTANIGHPVTDLVGSALDNRSKILLTAMIAAAKADGHIDDKERELLSQQLAKLNPDASAADLIAQELDKPLDINGLIASADSLAAASEIYLLSRLVVNVDNDQERNYLSQLAQGLRLAPELVADLDKQTTLS